MLVLVLVTAPIWLMETASWVMLISNNSTCHMLCLVSLKFYLLCREIYLLDLTLHQIHKLEHEMLKTLCSLLNYLN